MRRLLRTVTANPVLVTFAVAFRRFHKDSRARAFLSEHGLPLGFAVLLQAGWWYYMSRQHLGIYLWYLAAFMALAMAGLIVGLSGSRRRDAEAFRHSIVGIRAGMPESATAEVRQYLVDRASILSMLLFRGACEIVRDSDEATGDGQAVPPVRNAQNAELRKLGLWEELEPAELAMFTADDGKWTPENRQEIRTRFERLRLLRWTLRMDPHLQPLEQFGGLDLSLAAGVVERRSKMLKCTTLGSRSLRLAADEAQAYAARTMAELAIRMELPVDAEFEQWAGRLRAELAGESQDLLVGAATIAQLKTELLQSLFPQALERYRYASYLAALLTRDGATDFDTLEKTEAARSRGSFE